MFSRVALVGMDPDYNLAWRVQFLMSSICEELVARGAWAPNAHKLVKVMRDAN